MPVIIADHHDTAASITRHYLGYDDPVFAQRMWRENSHFMCRQLGCHQYFAAGQAVWIPEDNHPMGENAHHIHMVHYDGMSHHARNILSVLISAGYEVADLLCIKDLLQISGMAMRSVAKTTENIGNSITDEDSNISQILTFATAGAHSGVDAAIGGKKKFMEAMEKFQGAIKEEHLIHRQLAAKHLHSKKRKRLQAELKSKMQGRLEEQTKLQKYRRSMFSEKQAEYVFDKDAKDVGKAIRKKWVKTSSIFDTVDLTEVCEVLERFAIWMMAIDAAIDLWRLYKDPEQRKHWVYYLLRDTLNIGAAYLLGEGIGYLAGALIACSWELILLIIAAVALGGAIYWAYEHWGNPLIKELIEDPINEASNYIEHGLDNLMEEL